MTRILYVLLLGFLAALFINYGLSVTYKSKVGDYPTYPGDSANEAQISEYSTLMESYTKTSDQYSQTASAVSLGLAVIIALIGMMLLQKKTLVADGLILGGTLLVLSQIGFFPSSLTVSAVGGTVAFLVATFGFLLVLLFGFLKSREIEKA